MAILRIPTPLRPYTNGQAEIALQGKTVGDLIQGLTAQYPTLRAQIFNGQGELRPFVHLFINDEDIRQLQGLETPIAENDRLMLIPSIAGG